MRSLLLTFILLLAFLSMLEAQTPGIINYQAAVRQSDGKPIANEVYECTFEFNVGGQTYTETQFGVTDDFGVLNFQVGGQGIKGLDWSNGNAVMLIEFKGPTTFNDTVYLAAVPFALYAETSGSSIPGPAPAHEWDGTRIRFENPDGTFGEFIDLVGPQGNSVNIVGSVPTSDDLPSGEDNETGDLIFIESTGDGYVWNGEKWINLGKIQGPKGDRGDRGQRGDKGDKPTHQWVGTALAFENPDGTFGSLVDLKGEHGEPGSVGSAPQHQWMSSQLRFRNPDGSWGEWINLKGERGATGLSPEHQWNDTALRFRNPDGSWGMFTNLVGEQGEQGEKGDQPQHQWNGTAVRFENPDGSYGPYIDLQGPQGNSVSVVGSVPTVADLPSGMNNEIGDMIIVSDTGEGYVWTGDSWVNVGQVQGPPGEAGPAGPAPDHQWDETELRFRNADGTWGQYTDLKGNQGEQGEDGMAPEHEWNQTGLRFRNPDGSWGSFTDLQGPEGEIGLAPEHQWNQTALRFRNPDGTWGTFTNLKGDQGDQGIPGQQGPIGEQGAQGETGEMGPAPDHQWNQTALRFRNPDGTWGQYTNLKGDQGDQGEQGATGAQGEAGPAPEHQWNLTALRFRNPDGTWGSFTNLKGDQGEQGIQGVQGPQGNEGPQGVPGVTGGTGPAPEHQWNQTALRFRNPDGTWGSFTNLKGDQGEQGVQGEQGPPGASAAQGDVTGPLSDTKVEKIRGVTVSSAAPSEGQLLVFLNGAWRPATLPATGGDLSGAISNASVVGLRNNPLANESPQNGDVLQYLDGAWRPAAPADNGDDSGKVYAGALNQFGNQSYVSDPDMSVTVEGGVVTVAIAGVNLNGNNCSAVAIGRNNLNFYFKVTFLNGTARFTVNEPGVDPYPMNFMIFR